MDVHHIFGRRNADTEETCVCLCRECHMNHHNGLGPTTMELLGMMEDLFGYDYSPYAEFYRHNCI